MNDQVRFSRFVHLIPVEDYVAVYNAANLAIVFVSTDVVKRLEKFKKSCSKSEFLDSIAQDKRAEWEKTLLEMEHWHTLVAENHDDMAVIRHIQRSLENLPIVILYLLLTDVCNLACRYCFIEGGLSSTHSYASMTIEVAKKGIDVFGKALEANTYEGTIEPNIIFYGGEPLINWQVVKLALQYIASLMDKHILPPETKLTLNTNASLITPEIARALAEYGVVVAVSLDGDELVHNEARPFRGGGGTFNAVMRGVQHLQDNGMPWGVSCTISEFNLPYIDEVFRWFTEELELKSLGFNIRRETRRGEIPDLARFGEEASQALVRCYEIARERGIYEDRIMRKVRSFVEGKPHLNDCAGCGQQIVAAPTGEVGVCHGLYGEKKYFITPPPDFDPHTHPIWAEWRKRSPFSMQQCYDCVALGICGGGCPQQALLQRGSIWEIDEQFCIHAKITLDFLLQDLLRQVKRVRPDSCHFA